MTSGRTCVRTQSLGSDHRSLYTQDVKGYQSMNKFKHRSLYKQDVKGYSKMNQFKHRSLYKRDRGRRSMTTGRTCFRVQG